MTNAEAWQAAWRSGFDLNTRTPSGIAVRAVPYLPGGGNILDVACGRGRNALFFAAQGYIVDAFDTAELNITDSVEAEVSTRIRFRQCTAAEFTYRPAEYVAAIAARFIQYLDHAEFPIFINNIGLALKPNGIFGFSYALGSGELGGGDFRVIRYHHEPERVRQLLTQNGLEVIEFVEGAKNTVHRAQNLARVTYDVLSRKLG